MPVPVPEDPPPWDATAIQRRAVQEVDRREAQRVSAEQKREDDRLLKEAIVAEEDRRAALRAADYARWRAAAEAEKQAVFLQAQAAIQREEAQAARAQAAARAVAWGRQAKVQLAIQHRAFAALRAYYRGPRGWIVSWFARWHRWLDLGLATAAVLLCWGIDPAVRGLVDQAQAGTLDRTTVLHPALFGACLTVVVVANLLWRWQPPSLLLVPLGRGRLPLWLWAGCLERLTLVGITAAAVAWWHTPLVIRLPADIVAWQRLGLEGAQKVVLGYLLGVAFWWTVDHLAAWLNVPVPRWWPWCGDTAYNWPLHLRYSAWPPYRIMAETD